MSRHLDVARESALWPGLSGIDVVARSRGWQMQAKRRVDAIATTQDQHGPKQTETTTGNLLWYDG
jgi:hypothetical protein